MPATNVLWPTPLVRWPTLFPGQFGVPGTDSDRGLRQDSNGKILWVDPNHVDPSDLRDGTNPDSPLRTVAEALTQCRPYSGDVIAVMGNSFWTYGNIAAGRATPIAENVTVTVPGVRIVGIAPSGSLGVPWVPPLANLPCITVHAMDVLIEGFNFWNSGALAGTTGILAEWNGGGAFGENLSVRNCFFYRLAYGIQLDYAWNCYIEHCLFEEITTAAIHNPTVFGEPDYNVIRDNMFINNAADINLPACDYEIIERNTFTDVTAAITTTTGTWNTVHGNVINGNPAGANNYINMTGGTSNMVSDNYLGCTIAQYDTTCSDAGSGSWVFNHCTDGAPVAPPT